MKRKPKSPYIIKAIFPVIFWHKCDICKTEFKKEWGWKIKLSATSRIICSGCAPFESDAENLALTWGETGCDKPDLFYLRKAGKHKDISLTPPPKRKEGQG